MQEVKNAAAEHQPVVECSQVDERALYIVQRRDPVSGELRLDIRHRATMDDGTNRELSSYEMTELLESVLDQLPNQSGIVG